MEEGAGGRRPVGDGRGGGAGPTPRAADPARTAGAGRPVGGARLIAPALDAAGAGLPAAVLLAAQHHPQPGWDAAVLATLRVLTLAARSRYGLRPGGATGAGPALLGDWAVYVAAVSVVCLATGTAAGPRVLLCALLPALCATTVRVRFTHRLTLRHRRQGRALRRVLLVGEAPEVDAVLGALAQRTDHEYLVVGGCLVGGGPAEAGALPVTSRLSEYGWPPSGDVVQDLTTGVGRGQDLPTAATPAQPRARTTPSCAGRPAVEDGADGAAVLDCVARSGADTVLVVPGRRMPGERIRALAWTLADAGVALSVVPGLREVARHRIRLSDAAGLTLLHLQPPPTTGCARGLKDLTDRVAAAVLLAAALPLFAVVAAAVRLTSPGPAFYRQLRLGKDQRPFRMWKFRTMVASAEALRPRLQHRNEHDGAMFKIRRDPRVTPVGRFLRRSSLDELPQLLNVLAGQMSLVGPRPPLPEEVAHYDRYALRRLSVKPGITGLWQVSGRSDLSWDETVSLDLHYVDNWSWAGDVGVLRRTVRAVVDGRGAY